MNEESSIELPEAFKDGPWITGQEVMDWLGITKDLLKSWRHRGIIAYSNLGTHIMYNKPWILWRLQQGWTWKLRKKKPSPKNNRAALLVLMPFLEAVGEYVFCWA